METEPLDTAFVTTALNLLYLSKQKIENNNSNNEGVKVSETQEPGKKLYDLSKKIPEIFK
jgi:hypothetical protein